jgi:energy-coupling factor transporter ATP-binding protein EcfA2
LASSNVALDEDDSLCYKAKATFQNIQARLPTSNASEIKNMMPLQGKLRVEWVKLSRTKDQTHSKDGTLPTTCEVDELTRRMLGIRREQVKLYENGKNLISLLIPSRANEIQYPVISRTFDYLKMFLNDISMLELPQLMMKYHTKWNEMKQGKSAVLDNKAVRDADEALLRGSLGLEHVFRELSQIFEAYYACHADNIPPEIQDLPELTASLILAGHPFEIMDGNTSCVPIDWLRAVFKSLNRKLNGCRVFIVSALGLQSSGKSTLLNAMFGLEFAVSSGRCTRGVFGQLIKVDRHIYPFEYILVLDTEGLRAPELAMYNYGHDNELAAFVLGLGDLTIINFKGETAGEMQDVLQTAVHAFIKIRQAEKCETLRQKCIFTHQNVPSMSAGQKTLYSQESLMDKLDTMTRIAAQLESDCNTTLFKEVIDFDPQKHTWMFADLHEGEPPTAPINPGYAEKISTVRNAIMSMVKSTNNYNTMDDIFLRIKDLWKALSSMDFVFSFKNTLEAKAYDVLEIEYCEIKWSVSNAISDWYTSTALPRLGRTTHQDHIHDAHKCLDRDLDMRIDTETKIAVGKLQCFIQDHSYSSTMSQWASLKERSLHRTIDDIRSGHKEKLLREKKFQIVDIKRKQDNSSFLYKINAKAAEVAKQYTNTTNSELWKIFDQTIWRDILQELKIPEEEQNHDVDIVEAFRTVLIEELRRDGGLLRDELAKCSLHDPIAQTTLRASFPLHCMEELDLNIMKAKLPWYSLSSKVSAPVEQCLQLAHNEVITILNKVDMYIQNIIRQACDFEPQFAHKIIQTVCNSLDEFNQNKLDEHRFSFRPKFIVKLAVHVTSYAIKAMKEKHRIFDETYGFLSKVNAWKLTTWSTFKNTVLKKGQDIIAAEYLANTLKSDLKTFTEQKLPDVVSQQIVRKFLSRKFHLITFVLDDLMNKDHFESIAEYVTDAVIYTKTWLLSYTNELLFAKKNRGETMYANKAKDLLAENMVFIRDAIENATKYVLTMDEKLRRQTIWTEQFKLHLRQHMTLKDDLAYAALANINDFEHFRETLLRKLDDIETGLCEHFNKETPETVQWVGESPYDLAFCALWGCTECCPLCNEPCADSDPNHYSSIDGKPAAHKCLQHRPKCLCGTHYVGSDILVCDNCSCAVQQSRKKFRCFHKCVTHGTCKEVDRSRFHKYREYKKVFPSWDIEPSHTINSAKYWCWLACHYRKEFEKKYQMSLQELPASWSNYDKTSAKQSLRHDFKL